MVSHSLYVHTPYSPHTDTVHLPTNTSSIPFAYIQADQIGYSLAVSGFVAILLQIFITPIILARCDLIRVYNTCMRLWPWGFLAMPFVNLIARAGLAQAVEEVDANELLLLGFEAVDKKVQALVWCGVAAVLAFTRAACLAYS